MTIDQLFKTVIKNKASDLHLTTELPPILRISGELIKVKTKPLTAKQIEALVFAMIDKTLQQKFIKNRELDIAYSLSSGERFRVNLFFEEGSISMAARAIPKDIPSMKDLELPEIAEKFTNLPHGLVLVTGPTGSGKSTTLAAMVNRINKTRAENIITLEDPVEFNFVPVKSVIRQRQLGTDMLSFAEGMKHLLRQDPNVIMVGEMRDLETISSALTLAETGHLVFATLHTYSAAQTVDRIIDVFPPYQQPQIKIQLAMTLRGIISQQLVPKHGGGRTAIREILINNAAIANLIREGKVQQIKTVLQTSAKSGMFTIEQDIKRAVKDGKIDDKTADIYLIR
ncbi:MAG: type IV pili twitching motility protein PilT [Parcubacteria group bacterium CG10_big_fil_rev_8_21_14_0_10_36_14]|nr:MAG: type IV pili twitching motility protein PilT [Parcubacteria group bacterium CG10_big_fil_rev_8_21_14_0_10_36_14]